MAVYFRLVLSALNLAVNLAFCFARELEQREVRTEAASPCVPGKGQQRRINAPRLSEA